jgi:cytochrome c oxidase cbb3-type subunit IV
MFAHYLEAIEGIATYPLTSLLIFVFFFVGVFINVVRMKQEHVDKMSQMPLN